MKHFIGIDPGMSGGIAVLDEVQVVTVFSCKDKTYRDIADLFDFLIALPGPSMSMLEKVHAMPRQGVSSTFKFGQVYGFVQGLLVANKMRHDFVTPQAWQKYMGCLSKGDKNVTKSKAQQLFPSEKITHQVADALLIAEYCKRTEINF